MKTAKELLEAKRHHVAEARKIHDQFDGKSMPAGAARQIEAHLVKVAEIDASLSEPEYKHGMDEHVRHGDGSHGSDLTGGSTAGVQNPELWAKTVADAFGKVSNAAGVKAVVSGSLDVPSVLTDEAPLPQDAVSLLGLVPRKIISEASYAFLRQTVRDNQAAPVADHGLKPTSVFTYEEIPGKAEVVAHLSEAFPQRFLSDHEELVRLLRSEMAFGVIAAMEDQVVSGDGNSPEWEGLLATSGVTDVAYNSDKVTTLRKARTALALKSEQPTAFVLNPQDIEDLDLTRVDGATGEFLVLEDRIYGRLPVVPSLAVPYETALLADWRQTRLYVREGMRIDSDTSGELFDNNEVKLRAESRGNFHALRPQAVAVVDLAEAGS